MIFWKSKSSKGNSQFSEFIRNAKSGEKKKVYARVLDEANEAQRSVLRKANAASS